MTSVQDYLCIFCKESFEDKETLQIHFRKHGDPKFDQTARAKIRTQNDSPTSLEASKDDNETVSCDVCNEVFPTISKAITHKHKVHPDHDAKYFCPWCGKLFTLKHLYNKHLQSAHDSAESNATDCFHCDCCNVDFFIPSAMIYHNKFFHRQDTDIPAIGQSKKVKLVSQELVQIYYCPFCGEEYNNKINLHKHMTDDHSDEDQSPENILRCPLCEAIFYHLDAYELHLTFHSSEDLYSEENEMLKQIVEFSLDTVPPLMEKMEIPKYDEENEDLNAMGIDQFLQLTMSKDPDDEQIETVEKAKTKKHKKHKKSKKTITLDEFLNMNSDVFGEGLNVHGIEEVPTQIVTKQLKTKKDPTVRNNQKLVCPSDIDKLKKQGITIKMKSGKGPTPIKFNQQPSTSTDNKPTPMKSNKISTSSEVLSKLMNQSNSQVKVIKRGSTANTNVELDSNETNKIINESKATQENISFIEENVTKVSVENKELDKDDNNISKVVIDSERQMIALPDTSSKKIEEVCHKSPDSTYLLQNADSNNPAILNENTCTQNNFNAINDKIQNNITKDVHDMEDISNVNKITDEQMLSDFEEELASTTILRTNIPGNSKDIQSNEVNQTNSYHNEENIAESSQDDRDTTDTLNAIKHLGELISVKSVNHSTVSKEDDTTLNVSSQNKQDEDLPIKDDGEILENNLKKGMSAKDICKSEDQKESTSRTLNALKNLSKHVTIKSVSSQISSSPNKEVTKKSSEESDEGETINDREDAELTTKGSVKNILGRRVVNLRHSNKPTIVNNYSQIVANNSSQIAHAATKISKAEKSFQDDELPESLGSVKNTSNADLLKRLTNVTAKPIPSKKILNQKPFQTSNQSLNKRNMLKNEKINEEIEIFNIDDSDSDGQEKQDSVSNVNTPKSSTNPNNQATSSIPKPNEALRTLGKNITVKRNEQSTNKIHQNSFMDEESFPDYNQSFSDDDDDDDDFDSVCKKFDNDMNQFVNRNNKVLESTLKNLGKHITVKPKRVSLNILQNKNLERNTGQNESFYENDTESDSDSKTNKVKITEVTDNPFSDHEFMSDDDEKHTKNYVIQSPDAAHNDISDNFSDDEPFDKMSDSESSKNQISSTQKTAEKLNQLPGASQLNDNQKCPLSNFKKFNKEITIKSLKEKPANKDTDADLSNNIDNNSEPSNDSKESVVKPFRQNIIKYNTKPENTTQSVHQATLSTNEKATTSNQVNTVNKEVSVKTFQTQTVIEEITTTVTKTIRTVKQEVKSAKTNTVPTTKAQKILNYNNRIVKNAQNIIVRHPSPNVGAKIKNATQPNKPTASGLRPSNQLVPVRHGLNLAKPCNPTISPSVRNVTPKLNQQKRVTSRPLKIAPQVLGQTIKRSAQESTSQFSCFKKPKDTFSTDAQAKCEQDGEASMHSSTSQCRSDFTSTVKNMKGRSVVTATQMRSEIITSSHLSKLGNVSGLKIVKTSSKQATQVEERIENRGAKRTMEALQKLQMQGLLVKRPRSDGDNPPQEENDFSNSESENEEDTSEK